MKIHLYIEVHKVRDGKLGKETNGFVSGKYLTSVAPNDMQMQKAENKYQHLVHWGETHASILTWHIAHPDYAMNTDEKQLQNIN